MQTLVIGCGTIGSTIAALLCREGHNVTVIDRSRDNVQNVTDRLDAMGYCADGTNLDDLIEAGVKDTDLAIAVTEGDEKNFIACMLAKKAGNCQTICRVATAESQRNARFLRDEMGLSMVINPKILSARAIQRLLKYPAAIDVETFANGRVELSRYRVRENSILTDCPLKDLSQRIRCSILVCIVERNGKVFIPGGDFTLRANDIISVVADNANIMKFMKKAGMDTDPVRRVMIVGGSSTAEYLTRMLLELGMDVTLLEKDMKRCEELSYLFPKASIVHDDGTDRDTLVEEGVLTSDAFVALTSRDEENILLSLYVKSISGAKVISRMHHISYDNLMDDFDIGSVIVPQNIVANAVLRFVRAMNNSMDSNVETLYRLAGGRVEALEFAIKDVSPIIGVPLKNLRLKPQVIIAAIMRRDGVIIPGGTDSIQIGDRVIIITAQEGLNEIKEIVL